VVPSEGSVFTGGNLAVGREKSIRGEMIDGQLTFRAPEFFSPLGNHKSQPDLRLHVDSSGFDLEVLQEINFFEKLKIGHRDLDRTIARMGQSQLASSLMKLKMKQMEGPSGFADKNLYKLKDVIKDSNYDLLKNTVELIACIGQCLENSSFSRHTIN
jgi:hypothetical protein